MKYTLTAMCSVQNEATYLAEWMEFHILQGFEHFLIYDNRSTDNWRVELDPYIRDGLCTVIPTPPSLYDNAPGFWMLTDSMNRMRGVSKWHVPSGHDEYFMTNPGERVTDVLRDFEDFGGLAVNWLLFNSSGKLHREPGLVIERFTETYPEPQFHVKTIVQPDRVTTVRDPHSYNYRSPYFSVNEKREPCPTAFAPYFTKSRIWINHYHMMSRAEFDVKNNKGRSDIAGAEGHRRAGADAQWVAAHSHAPQFDTEAFRYKDALREGLKKRYATYNREQLPFER